MKELSFILSLKNKLSAPLGQAGKSVDNFANNSLKALKRLGGGVAGLWATAKTLTGVLKPASNIQAALDELSTRNVGPEALDKLSKQAAKFSTDFGTPAEDFISSVTAIRSSIAGLTDAELPRAALAVNTLAVAMKASSDDAAGYIADLASQFTDDVERMGRARFAESFASKTAWLVRNTGQDMAKIRALLQSAKGTGTSYGINADEQLAVLGDLGSSLGSNAGGVYEAFLKNARTGAAQLGMSFTDAQGRLLAFPDILDKLQAKYGDSVNGNIKLQEKLNKSFGKGAGALIKTWGSAEKLRKNIRALQGTQGLGGATEMAAKLSDIWQRLDNSGSRIKNAFGAALLPVFEPLINKVIEFSSKIARWLEMFPNITRWLGYIAAGLAGLAGLASLLAVISGVKLAAGVLGLGKVFTLLLGPLRLVAMAFSLLFSPVGLIIAAIVAVGVAVWYAVKHWDELKAAVMDSAAFQSILAVFETVSNFINGVWDGITDGWDAVVNYFSTRSPVEVFTDFVGTISGVFTGLWDYLKNSFANVYNSIISKLNKIPGVNIDLKEVTTAQVEMEPPPKISAPAGSIPPRMDKGGMAKSITTNNRTDKSQHIGQVIINPKNQETFNSLTESWELAAP